MNELTPETINKAVVTGIKMLTSESICTPNAWNSDLSALTFLLAKVLDGTMRIVHPLDDDGESEGKSH